MLAGEFLKTSGEPDGRCYFIAPHELVVLCYFKDGRKLKGPQLKYDQRNRRIEVRSKTWTMNGHQMCALAVIEKEKPRKTGYFVDEKLVKSTCCLERHTLDWILEDLSPL